MTLRPAALAGLVLLVAALASPLALAQGPDAPPSEGDFDMSVPEEDLSYLGDEGDRALPAPGPLLALAALSLAALALRRR